MSVILLVMLLLLRPPPAVSDGNPDNSHPLPSSCRCHDADAPSDISGRSCHPAWIRSSQRLDAEAGRRAPTSRAEAAQTSTRAPGIGDDLLKAVLSRG